MENLKVKVNNESERKEIERAFVELGYNFVNNIACEKGYIVASQSSSGINFDYWADVKEITLQYLKDLVVLKRNGISDANYESENGKRKYYLTNTESFEFINGSWVNIDEYVDGMVFKLIEKECEVKMKEYLDTNYELRKVKQTSGDNYSLSGWIEVPEGAEILYFDKRYKSSNHFFKTVDGKSYYKYLENGSEWIKYDDVWLEDFKENIDNFRIMWQRNPETTKTSIQEKLKFIEKWLNGEKIQYILGDISEKSQTDKSKWHNFTEGAMQYIKRPDIKFREAPKYVTINGIEFESVKSLLEHVKNNFDLEDGEKE